MKQANDLLAELELLDIKLTVENGALRYNAPKGALTQPLREKIGAYKKDILIILSQSETLSKPGKLPQPNRLSETDTSIDAPIPLQPRESIGLPLSTAQQRFWFLDQLDHGNSSAFNMPPMVIRLNGVLNISAFKRALNEIIRRHEVLRSSFRMKDTMADGTIPVQIPVETDNLTMDIPVHDIRTLDEKMQQEEIRKITLNEASTPFDLKN
ncbi:MAG: hypothetical protein HQK67_11990, partial [Desulfamplus sp.]|nr:hypothetical protein [Desulfamplus sp.]